jgi:DNA polymerase-4
MTEVRKIIHIDMDAFFASVEQRDFPELRGKPVAVGGSPKKRGVVAAASYEARRYGIHSAMPMARAVQLCKHLVIVKPRRDVYSHISRYLNAIYHEYTDLVEPLSLDECFLDVTKNKKGIRHATKIASILRRRIRDELALTASAGVAPNKFLAKLASDFRKPDGLTVVTPEAVDSFIRDLEIRRLWGVGAATEKKFAKMGITTIGQARELSEEKMLELFGKSGAVYYRLCRGIDSRPVMPDSQRKSVSQERTFNYDIVDPEQLSSELSNLSNKVASLLTKKELRGSTVTVKVRYSDFTTISRSQTLPYAIRSSDKILEIGHQLLKKTEAGSRPIRLLGIGLSNLVDNRQLGQLLLFEP